MHRFRVVGLTAVVLGAAGSVALMLLVGHRNQSSLLMLMFAVWVLSPFVALGLADIASVRWPALMRTTLYAVMLVVPAVSLALYAVVAFGSSRRPPAAMFLVVPVASWLSLSIAFAFAAGVARRRTP